MEQSVPLSPDDFWRDRRVFIPGHTGFKGSWLSLWLANLGAKVTGFSLPDDVQELQRQKAFCLSTRSFWGDVCDYSALSAALAEGRPEIVFHLAAQPLVRRSYKEPCRTYAVNVMGTAHILEAVRTVGSVKATLIITSDKCYEDRRWHWGYRENDRLGGHDPYSSSKACAELVSAAYRASYFSLPGSTALATARAGNVIGGGDWAEDRLIPDMVRAFTKKETVHIRNPRAVRPWQHVLEPLRGYMLLAQRATMDPAFADSWNFGPREADSRPVAWVVERFADAWGDPARWSTDESAAHPHETDILRLDCSKARETLGWNPVLDAPTALEWTVDWYRKHADGADPMALCQEQIAAYARLLEGQ